MRDEILLKRLHEHVNDPMWANHSEVSKLVLQSAILAINDGNEYYPYSEAACPSHTAHIMNSKICANCGIHIDSMR